MSAHTKQNDFLFFSCERERKTFNQKAGEHKLN